jgi:hypothetical protein
VVSTAKATPKPPEKGDASLDSPIAADGPTQAASDVRPTTATLARALKYLMDFQLTEGIEKILVTTLKGNEYRIWLVDPKEQ